MKLTEKINFRQPKYMLPAILYLPLVFCGFFVLRLFDTEKVETSTAETTEYYNDKLPDANIKGDGIGDKYTNMLNDFGKIKDESAVENIERDNDDIKENYESQYSDAEVAAMDQSSQQAQDSMERLKRLQEQMRQQQEKDNQLSNDRTGGNTEEEEQTLESLRQALADARLEGQKRTNTAGGKLEEASQATGTITRRRSEGETVVEGNVVPNEKAVNEISEDAEAEQVVKSQKETSEYFNTITTNEPEQKLIKAIVDEDIKAVDGSRVRLRLLDDIDIGERTIPCGTYLYCIMSGFSQQRVKGTVKSILINDELVKVNLAIYDTDGMEGLYVPKSSFKETTDNIASGALSQTMNLNDGSSSNTFGRWGMQALQNAYQKTTNALSKNIRKNKAKIKYGTQVYLINSKEKRNKK
ncbi:conjugative transposon protein TraM [Bacteroides thetaiotaomicron]|uniref:conjugative transposon protein TraM n=1 Tax=Bacteroides thetaiotaomicron TaxID=818 RepID=UPI00313BF9D9